MREKRKTALTIAGSDSGGGAGIQADLATFLALGAHGTSAVTCVTAQNPDGVTGIQAVSAPMVRKQIEAVFDGLSPSAVKTGMLYSRAIIETVADFLRGVGIPFVLDPVMVATSGARLLKPQAERTLLRELLPLAEIVTPNLDEAGVITGKRPSDPEAMREAARAIHEEYGCAALVKGGHLAGMKEAIDIFYDGRDEYLLTAPFIARVRTHGGGCAYSAAITALRANGTPLPEAVAGAKDYITSAISSSVLVGRYTVINHRTIQDSRKRKSS